MSTSLLLFSLIVSAMFLVLRDSRGFPRLSVVVSTLFLGDGCSSLYSSFPKLSDPSLRLMMFFGTRPELCRRTRHSSSLLSNRSVMMVLQMEVGQVLRSWVGSNGVTSERHTAFFRPTKLKGIVTDHTTSYRHRHARPAQREPTIISSVVGAVPCFPRPSKRARAWHTSESCSTALTLPTWRWCEEWEEHGGSWPWQAADHLSPTSLPGTTTNLALT